jgi:hypothetical protein
VSERGALVPEPIAPRRGAKRFLSAEHTHEICLRIITGELASREAAAQAGVDRSTSMALRKSAKDGAIAALQVLGPGRRRDAREASELARPQAEDTLLSSTIVEQAIELAALHGKPAWAGRPGSPAVPGDEKAKLLAIIDECVAWVDDRTRLRCARRAADDPRSTHRPETAHDAVWFSGDLSREIGNAPAVDDEPAARDALAEKHGQVVNDLVRTLTSLNWQAATSGRGESPRYRRPPSHNGPQEQPFCTPTISTEHRDRTTASLSPSSRLDRRLGAGGRRSGRPRRRRPTRPSAGPATATASPAASTRQPSAASRRCSCLARRALAGRPCVASFGPARTWT